MCLSRDMLLLLVLLSWLDSFKIPRCSASGVEEVVLPSAVVFAELLLVWVWGTDGTSL
jgi:hypothetical protein